MPATRPAMTPHAWILGATPAERKDILAGILDSCRPGTRMPARDRHEIARLITDLRDFLTPSEASLAQSILDRLPDPRPSYPTMHHEHQAALVT